MRVLADCVPCFQALPSGWQAEVELIDFEPFFLDLPRVIPRTQEEVKRAILAACLHQVGPENTPTSWVEGKLELMELQFLVDKVSLHA